jgi:hypothetical protein
MLAELELELLAAINASPIAANLKDVAAMPDGDGATLIKRFAAAAPGVYAVAGDVKFTGDLAQISFDLICIARNARGSDAARRGDGQTIGLYQMLDALATFLDGHITASTIWAVESISFAQGKIWSDAGLSAGSISLSCPVLPTAIDETTLGAFVTFHADYDIDPFQAQTEHLKWAAEPPDYTASRPELTDTTTLPQ